MDSKNKNHEPLPPKPAKLPYWNCSIDYRGVKQVTVGDVSDLRCEGVEPVGILGEETNLKYDFLILQEDMDYSLNILSVVKDEPYEKHFKVTSYYPVKGSLAFNLVVGEEEVFQGSPVPVNVVSVIEKKDQEPYPPAPPSLLLPATSELVAIFALIFIAIGYSFYRFFLKLQNGADYKRVLLKSDYPDLFMDFNIDLRNLSKRKNKVNEIFIEDFQVVFKKFFFRLFEKPVSFESGRRLALELRRKGVPEHKIRGLFALKKDYGLILGKNLKDEEIKDFLNHARKISSDLKKYIKSYSGGLNA